MRVSVVATGLAAEALKGKNAPASEVEDIAEKPSVFGWTGKQAMPPKKPVTPAVATPAPPATQAAPSIVSRVAQPAPQQVTAPAPLLARLEEEHVAAAQSTPAPVMPERSPAPAAARVRMPAIDDFPPQVKKQIEAQQSRIESIADQAQKKKPGLFQRLASVGLGRKDDPTSAQAPREPSIAVQQPPQRPSMQSRSPAPAPQPQHHDQHLDDDQLEIPAFLRRQAN